MLEEAHEVGFTSNRFFENICNSKYDRLIEVNCDLPILTSIKQIKSYLTQISYLTMNCLFLIYNLRDLQDCENIGGVVRVFFERELRVIYFGNNY